MATTKHTHRPNFGRIVDGCPRCGELAAGAAPVTWGGFTAADRRRHAAQDDAARRAHFAPGGPHATGKCGPICTAFDY